MKDKIICFITICMLFWSCQKEEDNSGVAVTEFRTYNFNASEVITSSYSNNMIVADFENGRLYALDRNGNIIHRAYSVFKVSDNTNTEIDLKPHFIEMYNKNLFIIQQVLIKSDSSHFNFKILDEHMNIILDKNIFNHTLKPITNISLTHFSINSILVQLYQHQTNSLSQSTNLISFLNINKLGEIILQKAPQSLPNGEKIKGFLTNNETLSFTSNTYCLNGNLLSIFDGSLNLIGSKIISEEFKLIKNGLIFTDKILIFGTTTASSNNVSKENLYLIELNYLSLDTLNTRKLYTAEKGTFIGSFIIADKDIIYVLGYNQGFNLNEHDYCPVAINITNFYTLLTATIYEYRDLSGYKFVGGRSTPGSNLNPLSRDLLTIGKNNSFNTSKKHSFFKRIYF